MLQKKKNIAHFLNRCKSVLFLQFVLIHTEVPGAYAKQVHFKQYCNMLPSGNNLHLMDKTQEEHY